MFPSCNDKQSHTKVDDLSMEVKIAICTANVNSRKCVFQARKIAQNPKTLEKNKEKPVQPVQVLCVRSVQNISIKHAARTKAPLS